MRSPLFPIRNPQSAIRNRHARLKQAVLTCPKRSEEHTSELQSRSDLVCRIIISEKHTSELQSRSDLVCRLLLEKKKNINCTTYQVTMNLRNTYKSSTSLDDLHVDPSLRYYSSSF